MAAQRLAKRAFETVRSAPVLNARPDEETTSCSGEMISLRRSPKSTLLWGDDQPAVITQEHVAKPFP